MESEFGPRKSWKFKFEVLEIFGIYLWFKLTNIVFICLTVSNCCLSVYINIAGYDRILKKRFGDPAKSWKSVRNYFVSKRAGTLIDID